MRYDTRECRIRSSSFPSRVPVAECFEPLVGIEAILDVAGRLGLAEVDVHGIVLRINPGAEVLLRELEAQSVLLHVHLSGFSVGFVDDRNVIAAFVLVLDLLVWQQTRTWSRLVDRGLDELDHPRVRQGQLQDPCSDLRRKRLEELEVSSHSCNSGLAGCFS